MECKTCKESGHKCKAKPPIYFKKSRAHFVHDVNHDGHHKARLAVHGNLNAITFSIVYSTLVSLKGIRLFLFLAELNGLESWGTGI